MMQGAEPAWKPHAGKRDYGSCRCCGRAERTARPQQLGKRYAFPTAPTAQTEGLSTTETKDVHSEQATPKAGPFLVRRMGSTSERLRSTGDATDKAGASDGALQLIARISRKVVRPVG